MATWVGGRLKPPWQPVSTAPMDCDLEVQIADGFGPYPLKFPCRLTPTGWINAQTAAMLQVEPIAWRAYVRR